MPDTAYLLTAAAIAAAVTWALRAAPFAALTQLRSSETLQYLRARMPAGVMVILALYTLRDLPLTHGRAAAPLIALAVTAGLHLWRRNALLSVFAGTAVSVILSSTLFAS
ncbi:branched-chain amino acid transporter permease [Streptomyces albidoflavus]|uniref:branched-chain amino acid transporter permease n=1 Tax=Streptomyces albidoflavus TaxID=1886 RepID=UPI00101E7541|nr:AzlD domain-containing protein [Streptomyces albidoflavus]RZD77725.1 branched-chain amino acid ABC transporter [Streptomyces albidoflavus]